MTPKRITLSMQQDAGFERHRKTTRRDVFLAEMDQVVPRALLCVHRAVLSRKKASAEASQR